MSTETKTIIKVETKSDVENSKTFSVEAPLFILFAEFLGYVSPLNKAAEDWCSGKVPDTCVQKVLIVEAKSILRQMKKDYSVEEIREFYEMYYPVIFEEYDDNLKKMLESPKEDD